MTSRTAMRGLAAIAAVAALAAALSACGSPPSPVAPGDQWVGPDGEPADADVIAVLRGPEHCDWHRALLLHVGWPLGEEKSAGDFRMYVRDPQGAFEGFGERQAPFDADVDLPESAEPSGWAADGAELWLAPDRDDEVLHIVAEDGRVEQWPRIDPPLGCA